MKDNENRKVYIWVIQPTPHFHIRLIFQYSMILKVYAEHINPIDEFFYQILLQQTYSMTIDPSKEGK